MGPRPPFDSLDPLLEELLTLGYFYNALERGRLAEWIAQAKTEWPAGGKQAEIGIELLRRLGSCRFGWLEDPGGAGWFYVTLIDDQTRGLSELWGEQTRRTLFEQQQRPNHPTPVYAWYFDRFLPWFWRSIKEEYANPNWPKLCLTRLRPPSPAQFVWLVRYQHQRQGLSQTARRELHAVLNECRAMGAIPDLAAMAREFEAALAASGEVTDAWLTWCRDLLAPHVAEVEDGAIISAAYLRPQPIPPAELTRLETVIADGRSWEPSNHAAASVKSWLAHLMSKKCEASPGAVVNHLIRRLAVARGYQDASGELRLVRYRAPRGSFSKHIDTLQRILRHALMKKLAFTPEEFAEFLALLPVLNTLNHPSFESVAKLAERFAETHPLTLAWQSQLAAFYDQPAWRDSDDLRKGTKLWLAINDRSAKTSDTVP